MNSRPSTGILLVVTASIYTISVDVSDPNANTQWIRALYAGEGDKYEITSIRKGRKLDSE